MQELGVTVVPFGERDWHAAVDAFLRFGRGRHKAALNFGDCFSYAAAANANDSLLFVGDDFSQTDITAERFQRAGFRFQSAPRQTKYTGRPSRTTPMPTAARPVASRSCCRPAPPPRR